jgi:hypothetical protein
VKTIPPSLSHRAVTRRSWITVRAVGAAIVTWMRGMPQLQRPRRVQIWGLIAFVLLLAAMGLFFLAMPRLRQYDLWGFF